MCKNTALMDSLNQKVIPCIHAQVIPTNHCNLSCKFCSCANRNKYQELTIVQLRRLAGNLKELGCEAVTITGGGEPLMHPDIEDIILMFCEHNIHVGLVTNGLLLNKLHSYVFNTITWCRVSCSDERKFNTKTREIMEAAYEEGPGIDWAFSYVLSTPGEFDYKNLVQYVQFANAHNFTHVRVVSDLLNIKRCIPMERVEHVLKRNTDDRKVIYQGRKQFDPGQRDCFISLLKPVIGADGFIYPCCGAQYAHENADLDMSVSMRMGHMDNINSIYQAQSCFDGSQCVRCYYKNYNDFLGILLADIRHGRFV